MRWESISARIECGAEIKGLPILTGEVLGVNPLKMTGIYNFGVRKRRKGFGKLASHFPVAGERRYSV